MEDNSNIIIIIIAISLKQSLPNAYARRGNPKQGLTSAKDLYMELPVWRQSPYHKLD